MELLKKNQRHIARISGYSSTGAGVCRIEERAVFVDFAIIGEIWEVLILKVTATVVFGKGIRLIEPSPARLEPECPVFGKCGGCDLLHMSYEEELSLKRGRVNNAFERIADLPLRVSEIIPASETARHRYRNKAIFNFSYDENGRVRAGFYRPRSHDLVPVEDCLIQPELATRAARALCAFMDETGVPLYDESAKKGVLRHMLLRRSVRLSGAVCVVVAAKGFHEHTERLVNALRLACPELTGIVLCINKSGGNAVLGGAYHTLWGVDTIEDELCGLRFRISPGSFYQINPPQAEKLYDLACDFAALGDGEKTVLDLYCGTGTITLALARRTKTVYGAEIVAAAVQNARENAERNGVQNVEFICGDAAIAALALKNRGISPDTVVVDPPRKGLSPELIETIAQMAPESVVYVSCDPGTLARDLRLFEERGFSAEKAVAVDMFPGTRHVETAVLIQRRNT